MRPFWQRLLSVVAIFAIGGVHRASVAAAEPSSVPPPPAAGDHTVMWWRDGFPARVPNAPWQRCIQTGRYGFVLDTAAMHVPHIGPVSSGSYSSLARSNNVAIASLPPADLGLFIQAVGTTYRCSAGAAWDRTAGPRLIESGRWVQRADVNGLVFTSSDGRQLAADARFETIAWPDRLALVLAVRPPLAPIAAGDISFGRLGGGFGLDGTNHLDVPHAPSLDPERFTLEFWAYLPVDFSTATKAVPWLVCKNYHEQADGNYGLTISPRGVPQAGINIGGGRDNRFTVEAREPLAVEAWSHLAMTYDGDSFRLFVNGKPAGEKKVGRQRRPGSRGLTFGRRQDNSGDGYHFRGAIDEIRLYDRALSAEQIRSRFTKPEAALADVEPTFAESFRRDGEAAVVRPHVVWQDAKIAIRLDAGDERLERRVDLPPAAAAGPAGWHDVSLAFDPATMAELADDEAASIVAVPLDAAGKPAGDPLPVTRDDVRGWQRINLDAVTAIVPAVSLATKQRADDGASLQDHGNDAIERVRLILKNSANREATVRLLFEKTAAGLRGRLGQSITGMSAILRDADGHPLGIPVQLSKNWHGRSGDNPYEGTWFHGFTQLRLPAETTVDVELTLAFAHWGGVPAASHAQLCLIGWGANQLWDESAMGSWGESICYEPDQIQAGCSILDVRPLMVTSMGNDRAWGWTNNVGGGDFFRLFDGAGRRVPHGRMKTAYEKQGPCLTEVTYAGQVGEGIEHAETVSLSRTDDIVRGVYSVRMDVKQPVEFSRLVLFQIGADTYSYTGERKMAVGDVTGLVREWATQWGGDEYRTQPLECMGTVPWVSLHEAVRRPRAERGAWANRGIVIREWRARLGGKDARPWVAERGAVVGSKATSTLDIVPPPDVTQLLPGDFVEATIEHLMLPQAAADYYGPNEPLRAALATMQDSWRLVHREAVKNVRRVEVLKGRLERLHPDVRVAAEDGLAEFTISGGLGYVPITVTGLPTHRGGGFTIDGTPCDQAVHGNDFWQTDFDPVSGTWSQTVTVPLPEAADHTIRFGAAVVTQP
jgi:hypothetical protein